MDLLLDIVFEVIGTILNRALGFRGVLKALLAFLLTIALLIFLALILWGLQGD